MAVTFTRFILEKALDSPFTITMMAAKEVTPYEVQDVVVDILKYQEETAPPKTAEAEKDDGK